MSFCIYYIQNHFFLQMIVLVLSSKLYTFSFSCLLPSSVFNKSGEGRYPCSFSFSGRKHSIVLLSMILAVGFWGNVLYWVKEVPSCLQRGFFGSHKWVLKFIKSYFYNYEDDHMIFFILFMWWSTVIYFELWNCPFISGTNPARSWFLSLLSFTEFSFLVWYVCISVHKTLCPVIFLHLLVWFWSQDYNNLILNKLGNISFSLVYSIVYIKLVSFFFINI